MLYYLTPVTERSDPLQPTLPDLSLPLAFLSQSLLLQRIRFRAVDVLPPHTELVANLARTGCVG